MTPFRPIDPRGKLGCDGASSRGADRHGAAPCGPTWRGAAPRGAASRRATLRGAALLLPALLASCSLLPERRDEGAPLAERSTRIERELASLRGLSFERPVPAGAMNKDELRAFLARELDKEWEKEGGPLLERAYKTLGLLPSTMDLKPWLTDFMKDQIGGFYDTETKHYWTIEEDDEERERDGSSPGAKRDGAGEETFVMAHELTHALEDQHFDLQVMQEARRDDDDASMAWSAMVEGSAMDAGVDHLLWRIGAPLSVAGPLGRLVPRIAGRFTVGDLLELAGDEGEEAVEDLAAAPPIIRAQLVFPYFQGWRFVNHVRSEMGWAGVDLLYRDPPESTEQILHPERWLDRRDRPVSIEPAAAPQGWPARYEETLGQLGARELFVTRLDPEGRDPERAAARAVEGWDGDRFVLWETPQGDAVGWITAWDGERDARRFERTYGELPAPPEAAAADASAARAPGAPDRRAITRRGNLVAIVEGAPAGTAEAAAGALLASHVTRAPDDRGPQSPAWRVLLWPLALRSLEHGDEGWLLGGLLLHFRTGGEGWKLRLLSSLALHAEANPDRITFWTLLGLVGFTSDRSLGWDFARIPLLFRFHHREARGDDSEERVHTGLVLDLLGYRRDGTRRQVSLGWGLLRAGWGQGTAAGRHMRLLWMPIF